MTGAAIVCLVLIVIPVGLGLWAKMALDRAQLPVETLLRADDGAPDIATSLAWSRGTDSRLLVGTQSGKIFRIRPDGSLEARAAIANDSPVMRIQPSRNSEHYDLMLEKDAFTIPDRGGRLLTLYQTTDGGSRRLAFSAYSRGLVATLADADSAALYSLTRLSSSQSKQPAAANSVMALAKWPNGNGEAVPVKTDPARDITRLASFGKSFDPSTDRLVIGDAGGNVAIVDQDRRSGADTVTYVGRHVAALTPNGQFAPVPANKIIALSATTLVDLDMPLIASAAADGSIKIWSPQAKSASGSGFGEEALAAFAPSQDWVAAPDISQPLDAGSAGISASGDLSQFAIRNVAGRIAVANVDPSTPRWQPSADPADSGIVRFSQKEVMVVRKYQIDLYARAGQWRTSFGESGDNIQAATFDNSGLQVAVAADDRVIRIYETSTGRLAQTFPAERAPIASLAFDPTGALVAAGLEDGELAVRNIGDLSSSALNVAPNTAVAKVGFSADGKRLLTIDATGNFRSFSVRSLRPLAFLAGTGSVGAISRNGAFVANTASTRIGMEIQLVDTTTGTVASRIRTGSNAPSSTPWISDDGNSVALVEEGGKVLIWKKTAGPEVETSLPPVAADGLTLSSVGTPLLVREPSGALHITTWSSEIPYRLRPVPLSVPAVQAALSTDGSQIIAACIDGIIRIIPAESTDPAQTIEISGHGDMVTQVALSPDDKYLASASIDGRVRITDLDRTKWLGRLPLSWLPAESPLEPMKPRQLNGQYRPIYDQPAQARPAADVQQRPLTAN